jgi:hypothetical protein
VLGSSTENVRYLSALLGVGSLVLIYRLGKDLSGKETGLLAALLLAANHAIFITLKKQDPIHFRFALSFCNGWRPTATIHTGILCGWGLQHLCSYWGHSIAFLFSL